MDSIEYMCSLISDNAACVIAVIAPVPKPVGVEGPPWRGPLPLVPIQFPFELCDRARSEIVVQPPRPDHSYLAHVASGTGQLFGAEEEVVTAPLHSALNDLLRRFFGGEELATLFRRMTKWLFDVNVFPRLERIQNHPVMPVFRG